jgi:hypothetical protein
MDRTSRVLLGVMLLLLTPAAIDAATYESPEIEPGTVTERPEGTTVVAVQGFKVGPYQNAKKPARVVGLAPDGTPAWILNGSDRGIAWFYDVDPLPNGTILVTGTRPDRTIVLAWDPETGETVWRETFPYRDTHDVDLINGDQLLIARMRAYNESTGENDAGLLLYDRGEDRMVWEWRFREHGYDPAGGGDYTRDWTHVNDVDKVAPGQYMASVRNFDETIVVDRKTGTVTTRLGSDDDTDVLFEQHNPDHLGGNDTPTILAADSENDRIVEYTRDDDGWTRTWELGSLNTLNWPRDADRLPNGNTLVVDTLNHRVLEVTPSGQVVWEATVPWGPYDVERMRLGDEPGGPTIRSQNATGAHAVRGASGTDGRLGSSEIPIWIADASGEDSVTGTTRRIAARWAHLEPWVRPIWMSSRALLATLAAVLVGLVQLVRWRGPIRTRAAGMARDGAAVVSRRLGN